MISRLLSLLCLLTLAIASHAQVITDHNSLLPDDMDVDGVVDVPVAVADTLPRISSSLSVQQVVDSIRDALQSADTLVQNPISDSIEVPAVVEQCPAATILPDYMLRSVFRSWRRSHPIRKQKLDVPSFSGPIMDKVDSLYAMIDALPANYNSEDMLFLYDMRLPIINTGNVPVDTLTRYYDETRDLENREETDLWRIRHFDQHYMRQLLNEEQRHLVRFRYASVDPRRFRYVRRHFDVPTTESHTLDTKTSVQQTRIADDLDIDFGNADLESFGQYFELKADKWHWLGDHTLTLQQTSLSDNWYKGGDNNMTVSGNQKITVKRFDEEAITTFEAVFDLKLSGYYTKADTVHNMKVSDNELSMTLKYGYKAWKKWYYSAQLYAKTPVFDYYKANSSVCKSTFLSPLELNLSFGVDYQYTSPNKKFTYSLLLAPLSYDLKAVRDGRVNAADYGIPEGDVTLHKLGSSITTKFEWKMSENASWSSRLYYFTPYNSLQVEFENTLNFKISRFLTARVYAYPRFDDSRDTKLEFKEMVTLGFSYQW